MSESKMYTDPHKVKCHIRAQCVGGGRGAVGQHIAPFSSKGTISYNFDSFPALHVFLPAQLNDNITHQFHFSSSNEDLDNTRLLQQKRHDHGRLTNLTLQSSYGISTSILGIFSYLLSSLYIGKVNIFGVTTHSQFVFLFRVVFIFKVLFIFAVHFFGLS